jgi:hypothetical protein
MGMEGITMDSKAKGIGRPKKEFAMRHPDANYEEADLVAPHRALLEIKRSILKRLIMRLNAEHSICSGI